MLKKSKIFENLGKNVQNLKIFWKSNEMSHASLLAKLAVSVNTTWILLLPIIDSITRWKRFNTSNKVRDAMSKKQIKEKKAFLVFIPDVKI